MKFNTLQYTKLDLEVKELWINKIMLNNNVRG